MIHVHVKLGPDSTGDELDVTVDYSSQADAYHVNVWGGPMVDVSRGDLIALRDKLNEVLERTSA